jgi:hypothetical protein
MALCHCRCTDPNQFPALVDEEVDGFFALINNTFVERRHQLPDAMMMAVATKM